MRKPSFVILFLLFSYYLFSQNIDSLRLAYNNKTIYRYGKYFKKGDDRLTFRELKNEFSFSEIAQADYEMAVKNRRISNIFHALSFASALASVSYINSNRKLAIGLLGAEFIFIFGASFSLDQSSKHLDRAIWQRNKDLLFPK